MKRDHYRSEDNCGLDHGGEQELGAYHSHPHLYHDPEWTELYSTPQWYGINPKWTFTELSKTLQLSWTERLAAPYTTCDVLKWPQPCTNWPYATGPGPLAYNEHYTRQLHLECGSSLVKVRKHLNASNTTNPRCLLGSKLKDCTVTGIPLTDAMFGRQADKQRSTKTQPLLSRLAADWFVASVIPVMRTPGPTIYRSPAPQRAFKDSPKLGPSWRPNRYGTDCACEIPGQDSFSFIYLWSV